MGSAILAMRGISKAFGETAVLSDVDFHVGPGEIVALLGENGAGKSTLMRLAAGHLPIEKGEIAVDGATMTFGSPADATAAGITIVAQHFSLIRNFTVGENLLLSQPRASRWISSQTSSRTASAVASASGINLPPHDRLIARLSVGEMARVELARALANEPQLLILDEPTSVLSPDEVDELFTTLRRVAATGCGVVMITHKLPEVFEIASRVVVLRKGRIVREVATEKTNRQEIAGMMTINEDHRSGVNPPSSRAEWPKPGESPSRLTKGAPRLEWNFTDEGAGYRSAPLVARSGEILAIAGVAGNGQEQLVRTIRGLDDTRADELEIEGERMTMKDRLSSTRIAVIPADRTNQGIFGSLSSWENIAIGWPAIPFRRLRKSADDAMRELAVRASSPLQLAATLSGGNQQKLLLARELFKRPAILVAAEPTRGLDAASSRFVRDHLRVAAEEGAAVVLLTSDLDEAFELAQTVQFIYRGALSPGLSTDDARRDAGVWTTGVAFEKSASKGDAPSRRETRA